MTSLMWEIIRIFILKYTSSANQFLEVDVLALFLHD